MMQARRGFSLVEMAVCLMLAGLIAGIILTASAVTDVNAKYDASKLRINKIDEAMERYAIQHNRLPLPARRNVGVESPEYGREVDPSAIGDVDVVDGVAFGAIPFQSLGIAPENAVDEWGNKLTYAVTIDMTDPTKYLDDAIKGAITIKGSGGSSFLKMAMYAILSHGRDELGAVKANYSGPDRKWCPPMPGLASQNCNPADTVLVDSVYNDGKNAGSEYYDDVIIYRAKPEAPVNGNWTPFNACHDGPCNGVGTHERTCTNPPPSAGGADCPGGPAAASEDCAMPSCSSGGGGPSCTADCPGLAVWGGGHCSTDPNKCSGYDQNVPVTNTVDPVHYAGTAVVSCVKGNWYIAPGSTCTPIPFQNGGWSAWSACSGCGTVGSQFRTCDNPVPSGGGADCSGPYSQSCSSGLPACLTCTDRCGGFRAHDEVWIDQSFVRRCNNGIVETHSPATGDLSCAGVTGSPSSGKSGK